MFECGASKKELNGVDDGSLICGRCPSVGTYYEGGILKFYLKYDVNETFLLIGFLTVIVNIFILWIMVLSRTVNMEQVIQLSERLIHLDLKGAPPKVSYLAQLFSLLKEWGATGILLEWEDTFPYQRELTAIGSLSKPGSFYTQSEAKQILKLACDAHLNVIPLVQVFGHLEFVLKHDEWRELREVERFPSSMCPSHEKAVPLVMDMLQQVIDFHNANSELQYIHIGADEVWHLGLCDKCLHLCGNEPKAKSQLYLKHILRVVHQLKRSNPQLNIIMWDDMLRGFSLEVLKESEIGQYVEPMVWLYSHADMFWLPDGMWDKFSRVFANVWIASAFKGATGSCQQLPVLPHHVSNHQRWLQELPVITSKFNTFRGIALTGWSRYDHYATLCELLPAALPSLAVCLKSWINGGYTPTLGMTLSRSLGFSSPAVMGMDLLPRPKPIPLELGFPGSKILIGMEWFCNLEHQSRIHLDSSQVKTWMNPWQIKNNYTNPMHVETFIPPVSKLLSELEGAEQFLREAMEPIYTPIILEEWVTTWIYPIREQLEELLKTARSQTALGARVHGYNI